MMYHHLELQVFDHLRQEITEKAGVVLTYEMLITVGRRYGADILISQTHPGLDFIKNIQELKFGTVTFRFRHFDYWKHFFKPFDYKMENEVRLLYETTASNPPKITDWIKGGEFSILIPMALFDEKSFPLDIEEIKIVPNMSARETNLLQIRQLVKDKTIQPISNDVDKNVSVSRIEHYCS